MINSENIYIKKSGNANPRLSNNFEICRICEFHVNPKAYESNNTLINQKHNHDQYISSKLFTSIRSRFKSEKNKEVLLPCNCLIPVHLDCLLKQAIFTNKLRCSNCNFYYTIEQIKSPLISKLFSPKFIYINITLICLMAVFTYLIIYVALKVFELKVYPWKIMLLITMGVIDLMLVIGLICLIVHIQKSPLNDILMFMEYDKDKYSITNAEKSNELFSNFLSVNFDITIGDMFDFLIKETYVMTEKERRYESFAFKELEKTIGFPQSINNSRSVDYKYIDQHKDDNQNNIHLINHNSDDKNNNQNNSYEKPKVTYSLTIQKEEGANVKFFIDNDNNQNNDPLLQKDNLLLINRYALKMTKIDEVDSKLVVSNEDTLSIKKPSKLRFSRKHLSSNINYEPKLLGPGILKKQSSNIVNGFGIRSEIDLSNSDQTIQFNQSQGEDFGRRVHSLKANLKELSPILKTSSNSLNDSLRPKLIELFTKGTKTHEICKGSQVINNINKYNIQNLVINTGSDNKKIVDFDKILQGNIKPN